MEKLEALFQQTAGRINVTKHISQNAWLSYKQVYCLNESVYKEKPTDWFVVHIYLALLEQAISSKQVTRRTTSVTVSLLLNISKMHCKDFITKLKLAMEQKLASPLTEDVVNELIRKYILTAALYDKCSRIFSDIFVDEPSATDLTEPNYHKHLCDKKKMVWLLYCLAKEETSFNMSELVTSFYVLLCCFIPVLKSTPAFLLKAPWGTLCGNSSLNEHEQTNLVILQRLCTEYKADLSEVFVPVLQSKQWTEFLVKYDGLSLPSMSKSWCTLLRPLSVDALDFIQAPSLVVPNKPALTAEITHEIPPTPVQYRLNTIQHLKNIVCDVTDRPSTLLTKYFQCCGHNPEEAIILRLNEMRDRYVNAHLVRHTTLPSTLLPTSQEIPTHRFSLITRLYYKVLQTLLKQEEERLSKTDFSTLLHIDTFHRSLVTCCALIVNHTYNEQSDVDEILEYLLNTFNIEAYHMCKVIECFIKAEPELSKSSIHHLKLCENHILESLAWKTNSPLYDVLMLPSAHGGNLENTFTSPVDIHSSYTVGAAQFLTPPRRRVQDRPLVENGQPPRSRSLAVFLNKVCRLAYHRLQLLCTALVIPRDVTPKIWTCLEYCIKSRSDLLRGRQLDQIIMCCLYAISRVLNQEVKFKTIVAAYENLPHQPKSSIYKRVQMSEASLTGSIISFYNQLYMQSMKTYLLQFSPDRRAPPLSPAPKAGHSPLRTSPRKMTQNVFVSPMKSDEASKVLMTPRSSQLYCFGGLEGTRQLQSINDTIKLSKTPPSATKRLVFDSSNSTAAGTNCSSSEDRVKPSPSCGKRIKFE